MMCFDIMNDQAWRGIDPALSIGNPNLRCPQPKRFAAPHSAHLDVSFQQAYWIGSGAGWSRTQGAELVAAHLVDLRV